MDASKEPALDELLWRDDAVVLQEFGAIHSNTVLFYFSRSPFFDATSNNNVLWTQAMNNPNLLQFLATRQVFEQRLRSMQGMEFVVTQDPSEGDTKPMNSGVWVITKQMRKKRGGMIDEVTPISCYYVVGENICMAPCLGKVLGSRLLSIITSLSSFLTTAQPLPDFTPALGHTYLPPTSKPASTVAQSSKEGTPMPGGTPRPNAQAKAPITQKAQKAGEETQEAGAQSDYNDARLFYEAWDLSQRYGNDYMDENPLIGEPGNFKLTKARDLALAVPKTTTAPTAQPFRTVAIKPAAPAALKTDLGGGGAGEKEGVAPLTGKTPVTPGAGLKDKKGRRKSKAAGVATPKADTPKADTPKAITPL